MGKQITICGGGTTFIPGSGDGCDLVTKDITENGTYNASSDFADGYSSVSVDVPNSYSAGDEGKVVSNGALVSQGSHTITENGTYDTTLISELIANIAGGGGGGGDLIVIADCEYQTSGAFSYSKSATIPSAGTYTIIAQSYANNLTVKINDVAQTLTIVESNNYTRLFCATQTLQAGDVVEIEATSSGTSIAVAVIFSEDSSGGSTNILSGTDAPTSSQGSNGQIYLQYDNFAKSDLSSWTDVHESSMSLVAKTTNGIQYSYVGGGSIGAYAYKQIDLTDVDTMEWSITSGSSSYNNYSTPRFAPFIYLKQSPSYASDSDCASGIGSESRINADNTTNAGTYDVSNLTGNWYVCFNATGCSCTLNYLKVSTSEEIIEQAYLKVSGTWQNLIGSDINDVDTGGSATDDWTALKDYIQSSGTQWIDTGYVPNNNSIFELVANVPSTQTSDYPSPLGIRDNTSQVSGGIVWVYTKYNTSNMLGSVYDGDRLNLSSNTSVYCDKKINLRLSRDNVYVKTDDGVVLGLAQTAGTYSKTYSLGLFDLKTANSIGTGTSVIMKLYRFRIYEGTTLVHEFIPWTDTNDVVCLKDTVTNTLKYNAGTGVFTRGTDN